MIVAIHQPNYLPWLGYIAKILDSDIFVFLDNVQFSKKSLGARNYIIDRDEGKALLSVSVKKSFGAFQNYNELEIDYSSNWNTKHLNKIKNSYVNTLFFHEYYPKVESLLKKKYNNLADLNIEILTWIISLLDCTTKLVRSSELILGEDLSKNDNNILICEKLKASIYLSGRGAIKYNNQELYSNKGIVLKYQEFHHPIYHQNNKQFIENLCFLDALFFIGIDNLKRQLKKLE